MNEQKRSKTDQGRGLKIKTVLEPNSDEEIRNGMRKSKCSIEETLPSLKDIRITLGLFEAMAYLNICFRDCGPELFESDRLREIPINQLGLQTKTHRALSRHGVLTLDDLISFPPSKLAEISNLGPKAISEIARRLNASGLWFRSEKRGSELGDLSSHQPDVTWTEALQQRLLIAHLADSKFTNRQIAEIVGRSHQRVAQIRSDNKKVLGNLRKKPEETKHREAKTAKMVELRLAGHSLSEIGAKYGVTRERVRQLLKAELGAEAASGKEIRARRSEQHLYDIRSYFAEENKPFPVPTNISALISSKSTLIGNRPDAEETIELVRTHLRSFLLENLGMRAEDLHETSGLKPSVFKRFVPSELARFTVSGGKTVERKWTDDEILNALQKASTYHFPLTGPKYDALIAVGEIDGPGLVRILQIFGTWKTACDLAGVESGDARRDDYERKWSEQDLLDIVAEYLLQEGSNGTFYDFDSWLKSQSGYPSGQTVRNYLGEWLKMKHDVLTSDRFKERINE